MTSESGNPDKKLSQGEVSRELVTYELTKPSLESKLDAQLVVNYLTINGIIDIEIDEGSVNSLLTIISHKQSRKIFAYACQHKVWLMRNLWRTVGVTKTQAYEVINRLIRGGLLKKTLIKVNPPLRQMKGSRPRIYTWAHLEVEDAMDPRVQKARERYWETFRLDDPEAYRRKESTENLLYRISQLTVDYYTGRAQCGKHGTPDNRQIITYIKRTFSEEIPDHWPHLGRLAQDVGHTLHFTTLSPPPERIGNAVDEGSL